MNNTIEIALCNGIIKADYKTKMIDLKSMEKVANAFLGYHSESQSGYKRLRDYLDLKTTNEYISVVESKIPKQENPLREIACLIRKGRGINASSYGNLFIAIDFAMWLSPEFKYEVLKTFIESRILDYRLFGVEQFKNLNIQLDKKLNARLEDYKAVSVAINIKCNGGYIEGWNHAEANPDIQKLRNTILDKTAFAVEMELITTLEQLINTIEKL